MNSFPNYLSPNNKSEFNTYIENYYLEKLRKKVFVLVLRGKENDFFDLDTFNRTYINDMSLTKSLVDKIVVEIESLGWKTKFSYGDTALFIYSTEKAPIGAW